MFRLSFEFVIGGNDRGKDNAVQKLTNDLVQMQQAVRTQRFVALQEQIRNSIRARITERSSQPNEVYLSLDEEATDPGSKLHVTATGDRHRAVVVTFKPDEAQVRIKSEARDTTIRVRNVGTVTGLERKEGNSRSWSVLENEAAVERLLDAVFQSTFDSI